MLQGFHTHTIWPPANLFHKCFSYLVAPNSRCHKWDVDGNGTFLKKWIFSLYYLELITFFK